MVNWRWKHAIKNIYTTIPSISVKLFPLVLHYYNHKATYFFFSCSFFLPWDYVAFVTFFRCNLFSILFFSSCRTSSLFFFFHLLLIHHFYASAAATWRSKTYLSMMLVVVHFKLLAASKHKKKWKGETTRRRNCNCAFCIFIYVLLNKSRFPYHFSSYNEMKIVSNLIWCWYVKRQRKKYCNELS